MVDKINNISHVGCNFKGKDSAVLRNIKNKKRRKALMMNISKKKPINKEAEEKKDINVVGINWEIELKKNLNIITSPIEIIKEDIANPENLPNFNERGKILEKKYGFTQMENDYQYARRVGEYKFEFITLTQNNFEGKDIDIDITPQATYSKEEMVITLTNNNFNNLGELKEEEGANWKTAFAKMLYEDKEEHYIVNSLRGEEENNIDFSESINFNISDNFKELLISDFIDEAMKYFEKNNISEMNNEDFSVISQNTINLELSKEQIKFTGAIGTEEEKIEKRDYLKSMKPLLDFKKKTVYQAYLKTEHIKDEGDLGIIHSSIKKCIEEVVVRRGLRPSDLFGFDKYDTLVDNDGYFAKIGNGFNITDEILEFNIKAYKYITK